MKTIAFFNNKGGVGKTSLVYHLAWMLGELGYRVLSADLDPQANLSGALLGEKKLEEIWGDDGGGTIERSISPLFEGTGDIVESPHVEKVGERISPSSEDTRDIVESPHVESVGDRIGLLVGDLALSKREDELSAQWHRCMVGEVRAFRVATAFARLIARAGKQFEADLALVDVGPNLGAINRTALIASDHVVMPLAPDFFSLQGLRNVGPTLRQWRNEWRKFVEQKPPELNIELPTGEMAPLGYIIMRHAIRLDRPVKAFEHWIQKMPGEYAKCIIGEAGAPSGEGADDRNLLAHLKDYRSLMPMAQEANKPMFRLKPADGVMGAQQKAVVSCYEDFRNLANTIIERLNENP